MRQVNKADRERWAEGKRKSWRERERVCQEREYVQGEIERETDRLMDGQTDIDIIGQGISVFLFSSRHISIKYIQLHFEQKLISQRSKNMLHIQHVFSTIVTIISNIQYNSIIL